jgi:hypothetical protein
MTDVTAHEAYSPPAVTDLGTVQQLTLGQRPGPQEKNSNKS